VARPDGTLAPGSGWTGLVIDSARGVGVVDGLITGWHEPRASHLQMLAAIAGDELLAHSYSAALGCGYCGTSSATATSSCADAGAKLAGAQIIQQPHRPRLTPGSISTAPPGQ